MKKLQLISFLFSILLTSCASYKEVDSRWGMNANVCKRLHGDVLVYAVFVDVKELPNWEIKDITQTIDSIKTAINWIQSQAGEEEVKLNLQFDYFKQQQTINKNFPEKLSNVVYNINKGVGADKINKWSNNVSKLVGNVYETKKWTDSLPHISKPNSVERLVAMLRDEYQTESVVVFFLLNGQRKQHITLTMNYASNENIEYVINSYKNPSIFAFEILRVFGAANLYTPEVSGSGKAKTYAQHSIPDDIMVNPFSQLENVEISEFTQYMIGWNTEEKDGYEKLFLNKKYRKKTFVNHSN